MDSDEDELLYELDAVVATGLQGQLNLFQYPVSYTSDTDRRIDRVDAKVKPIAKKIEMEILIDTQSQNYDRSKGELISVNVDGAPSCSSSALNPNVFESDAMDKIRLTSSTMSIDDNRFVAGVIHNNCLHLTPISSVQKLRPNFFYIDKSETRSAQNAKAKAANDGDSSQDEMEDAKAVTMRFKGAESDISKALREKSYSSFEKKIADETWIQTTFHHKLDSYAERERLRLVHQVVKSDQEISHGDDDEYKNTNDLMLNSSEYKLLLVPTSIEGDEELNSASDSIKLTTQSQAGELSNKVQKIMQKVQIIKFSHLISILPENADQAAVVQLLPVFACLVQGLWIVKSEEIYPTNTLSPGSGIPSESLCRARDFILYKFTKSKYLCRKDISLIVKIPDEDILTLFRSISYMKPPKGWRLRFSCDKEFTKKFPQQTERQKLLWTSKYNQLVRYFNLKDPKDGNKSLEGFSTSEDESNKNHFSTRNSRKSVRNIGSKKKAKPRIKSPKHNGKLAFIKKEKQENEFIKPKIVSPKSDGEIRPFVSLNSLSSSSNSMNGIHNVPTIYQATGLSLPKDISESINIDNVNSTIAEISSELAKVSPRVGESELLFGALQQAINSENNDDNNMDIS